MRRVLAGRAIFVD